MEKITLTFANAKEHSIFMQNVVLNSVIIQINTICDAQLSLKAFAEDEKSPTQYEVQSHVNGSYDIDFVGNYTETIAYLLANFQQYKQRHSERIGH